MDIGYTWQQSTTTTTVAENTLSQRRVKGGLVFHFRNTRRVGTLSKKSEQAVPMVSAVFVAFFNFVNSTSFLQSICRSVVGGSFSLGRENNARGTNVVTIPPFLSHQYQRPDKQDAISYHCSRFSKQQ